MKKILSSLICISVLLSASDETDIQNLSLEELLNVEISGATLTACKNSNVPAAVTVFERKQISQMGIDSLDELMGYVPGFQSYRTDDNSLVYTYSSRGRRTGSASAEVLIIVDGMRLNDARIGGAALVMPKIPLEWIERVEFIRGGGSALYGSNAMQGVINIITVKQKNELEAAGGSYDRLKAVALGSYSQENMQADVLTFYDHSNGENYTRNSTFDSNTVVTNDPYDIADLYTTFRYGNTQLNYLRTHANVENFYLLGNISNPVNNLDVTNDILALENSIVYNALVSTIMVQYSGFNTNFSTQAIGAGELSSISNPSSSAGLAADSTLKSSEWRGSIENDYTINADNSIQFGGEYRRVIAPELDAYGNFDLTALAQNSFPIASSPTRSIQSVIQSEHTQDIYGVFAQYQTKFLENLILTFGGRVDKYEGLDEQFSYKTAAVYQLSDLQSLKAIYGKSFRAPNTNELYLENNPLLTGNPALQSESIQNLDLIWVGSWEQKVQWSIGYFENRYNDAIVQVENTSGAGSTFENIQQDPVKGFELELEYQPQDAWMFRGTYTYFTTLPDLSYRESNHLLSLIGNYHYEKLNVNLSSIYNGKREYAVDTDSNRYSLPSYWLVNTKVSYQLTPALNVFLQGKNILDKTYITPSGTLISTDGISNRGCEMLAGIIWHF
jgi:outer membrane cobalamin receptor